MAPWAWKMRSLALLRRSANSAIIHRCMSAGKNTSSADYCLNVVQKADHERYLTNLLLPTPEVKRSAFAVCAFNVQIAQVLDVTNDRTIGQMRLQFWRDSLDLIYKNCPPEQPVSKELSKAVLRHDLSREYLKRIIDGRWKYVSRRRFNDVNDLESYADNTNTSLHCLLLEIMNVKNQDTEQVASHIGKAQGLVTVLRSLPILAHKGEIQIPMSSFVKHKVSEEDILRGSRGAKMKDLVLDLAGAAKSHLETARSIGKEIPSDAKLVFLSAVSMDWYLRLLEKRDFDVFHASLRQRNNLLPLQLILRKWRRKF